MQEPMPQMQRQLFRVRNLRYDDHHSCKTCCGTRRKWKHCRFSEGGATRGHSGIDRIPPSKWNPASLFPERMVRPSCWHNGDAQTQSPIPDHCNPHTSFQNLWSDACFVAALHRRPHGAWWALARLVESNVAADPGPIQQI